MSTPSSIPVTIRANSIDVAKIPAGSLAGMATGGYITGRYRHSESTSLDEAITSWWSLIEKQRRILNKVKELLGTELDEITDPAANEQINKILDSLDAIRGSYEECSDIYSPQKFLGKRTY